jgi:ABC-2 type transport system permease protein
MTTAVVDRPALTTPNPELPSPIPFGRLVSVEWRKTIGTRAARWIMLAVGLVTIGVLAIPLAVPDEIAQTLGEYVFFAGTGLSILLPVVLILSLTSEWSQRTALATFTQEPRRGRVLLAKLSIGILVSVGAAIVAAALGAAALLLSSGLGRDVAWTLSWEGVAALLAFSVLNVLMGMAFGAVLHNTAAAIVLFYLLGVLWSFLGVFEPIRQVAEWLDPNRALGYVQSADWSGRWPEILTALAVWIVLPLIAGAARTIRRDVS